MTASVNAGPAAAGTGPAALLAAAGVPLAAAGLAAAFHGPRSAHWRRLAVTHGTLGLAALVAQPSVRPGRLTRHDALAAAGLSAGILLVGSFADARARGSVDRVADDAAALRDLSKVIGPARMCAYLALVVAPGEELFWRGLLQDRLTGRYGTGRAAVLTSALYTAAHVATGNTAVTGAAMGMGSTLSFMRARGAGVGRLALAHALWVVPTLLRERARGPAGSAGGGAVTGAGPDDVDGEGERDMAAFRHSTATGREVSRWSRWVQLVNNVAHVALYERTNGRLGKRMLGNQVGILTTLRPQGGDPYSVPLFTFPDGEDVVVVASYRGSVHHPRWYRNLLANPDAVLRVGGRVRPVRATVMEGEERAEWWQRIVGRFQGYAEYQRRTSRELPLVRLTPRPDAE
ncbi:hypothetical protein GCM10010297_12390 [Streptomyces malachitofuscus]|nr:hypothetical protein GCM10010297_12390 [Streptomyces malachitofuscus]